jgi:hypothetical protein
MSVHPPAGGRLRDRHPCLASRASCGSAPCVWALMSTGAGTRPTRRSIQQQGLGPCRAVTGSSAAWEVETAVRIAFSCK